MFAGFNLVNLQESFFGNNFNSYVQKGEEHLKSSNENIRKVLHNYIKNGVVDGTKLQNDWFPNINADIFISHSHKDTDLANALSGWLNETFKLKCFVDSNIWGNMNQLLRNINDNYSNKRPNPNGGFLFDLTSCNIASTHVNMMLNIALQKMIDKTEAVILLNTNESIKIDSYDVLKKKYEGTNSTFSSWIYSEIITTEIVRKQPLSNYRQGMIKEAQDLEFFNKLYIEYDVSLEHLQEINPYILSEWEKNHKRQKITPSMIPYNIHPLDTLYLITHPEKIELHK